MSQNSLLIPSVLVLIAGACAAQDGEDLWNQCGETVIPACRAYVAAFSTEKEIKAAAEKDVRLFLVLQKIAQEEKIEAKQGESIAAKTMEFLMKEAKWEEAK